MAYAAPHHGFRTFVIVWLAQSLSVIGSGMTGFALNVYLAQVLYPAPEQKPELALAFTVLNLGFTIPFVFGGPLAGAWADRHDRKQIMIVTNTANGLVSLLTVFLMLSGSLQLWMLVSIGVLAAAAGAFHLAAFDASYAMLVPDSLLPRANGMMQDYVVHLRNRLACTCGIYNRASCGPPAGGWCGCTSRMDGQWHSSRHCNRCPYLLPVHGRAAAGSRALPNAQ